MSEILDAVKFEPTPTQHFQLASKGKRLVNYLIDTIVYYGIIIFFGFVGMAGLYASEQDAVVDAYVANEGTTLFDYLFVFIIMIGYYTVSEYYFKGKTIGKYLTKTRAVTLDGRRLDFGSALKRSLARLIPFDGLSFLGVPGKGWHDSLPRTKVIDDLNWTDEEEYYV